MSASILIVDDDAGLASVIEMDLKKEGYKVRLASDADEGLAELKDNGADLILLDVELPGVNGFMFLEMLKSRPATAGIPVLMLTVRGEERNKVKGLKAGADDYLVKPFSSAELAARVEALLRRAGGRAGPSCALSCGPIRLDVERLEATLEGKPLSLRPAELKLLEALLRRKTYVVAQERLLDELSEGDRRMTSENLQFHVSRLRSKLGRHEGLLTTIRGKGYKLSDG